MTPAEVLTKVLEAGGQVIPHPEHPRLLVPPDLKPLVAEHREALRRLVLYWEALRRWFELTAQGPEADQGAVTRTYQAILRLTDDVGEPQATQLRRQWARQWWQETWRCPWCGEAGPYHDPERQGEPA